MNQTSPSSNAGAAQAAGLNQRACDVIGDIHGQAGLLRTLLQKLGYHEICGVWRHPDRIAIFVGDFIDRGPAIPETLSIVRAMVTAGSALAVMGNHEFDALLFDHNPKGHSDLKNQLEATHAQFKGQEEEWQGCLAWFRTLPLALDLGVLRVVHAGWSDAAVQSVSSLPCPLDDAALRLMDDPKSKEGRAAEMLLNGLRLVLPGDLFVLTHRGMPMNWMRAKWWIPMSGRLYDDVAFPDLDVVPRKPIVVPPADPAAPAGLYDGYPIAAAPVFTGHYSLPLQATPKPMAPNVACLDYSVWKGGPLVSYRFDGERELSAGNFVTSTQGHPSNDMKMKTSGSKGGHYER